MADDAYVEIMPSQWLDEQLWSKPTYVSSFSRRITMSKELISAGFCGDVFLKNS